MFQPEELIVYGSTGICRVEAVGPAREVRGADPDRLYYTLAPLYQPGVIYTPVDTPVFMRPALTREAVEELIAKIPFIQEDVCPASGQKELSEHYQAFLESHQCEDLLQLIKSVYVKSRRTAETGKRPGQVDQRYRKRAEDLLNGEFAAALGIAPDEVAAYIAQRLEQPPEVPSA